MGAGSLETGGGLASKVEKLPPMERRWQWRRGESGREVWSGQARRVAASPTASHAAVTLVGEGPAVHRCSCLVALHRQKFGPTIVVLAPTTRRAIAVGRPSRSASATPAAPLAPPGPDRAAGRTVGVGMG